MGRQDADPMRDLTRDNFGLLIAYVLPGFVALWGVSFFSETVQRWLGTSSSNSPTIGGFLYVTVAAVAVGLLVSTVRWMTIDRIHHFAGIAAPKWDFSRLGDRLPAFELLVASHYQFYQWHANMAVACLFTFLVYAFVEPLRGFEGAAIVLSFVVVEVILWIGSRDALRKYYLRTSSLMNVDKDGRSKAVTYGKSN